MTSRCFWFLYALVVVLLLFGMPRVSAEEIYGTLCSTSGSSEQMAQVFEKEWAAKEGTDFDKRLGFALDAENVEADRLIEQNACRYYSLDEAIDLYIVGLVAVIGHKGVFALARKPSGSPELYGIDWIDPPRPLASSGGA